jgi:MATE family multidrug resistance protein
LLPGMGQKFYAFRNRHMNLQSFRAELRILLHLGLPIALAELSTMLLATLGTFMIGQVNVTDVAAAGATNPVFWLIALIGIGGLSMTSPLVAAADERNDPAEVKRILIASGITSLFFALLEGAVLMVIALNFHWLGHEQDVARLAQPYLWILIAQLPMMSLYFNLVYFTDGLSMTKVGLVFSLGGALLGGILNWFFVFGVGGVPKMGVTGLGLSSCITISVQLAAMIVYLRRSMRFKTMMNTGVNRNEIWSKTKEYISLALPVSGQALIEYSAYSLGAVWVGHLGKYSLAGHQVAMTLVGTTFVVLMAIGTAGSIRIGQAFGQKNHNQIRLSGFSAMFLAVMLVLIPALGFMLGSDSIARAFIDDPKVWDIASALIVIAGLFQVSDAMQSVGISLLRGLEDTRMPSVISFIAYWVLGMPIAYWLCFTLNWGVKGIWMGFLIALSTQAIWFTWRFYHLSQKQH